MNKGTITIIFNNGMVERIDIVAETALIDNPTWTSIAAWWMADDGDKIVYIELHDETALMMDKDKVSHIKLEPKAVLEIS